MARTPPRWLEPSEQVTVEIKAAGARPIRSGSQGPGRSSPRGSLAGLVGTDAVGGLDRLVGGPGVGATDAVGRYPQDVAGRRVVERGKPPPGPQVDGGPPLE